MAHIPTLHPLSIKSAADTRAFWELPPNARTPMPRFAAFDVFIDEIVKHVREQLVYVTSFIQDETQVKIFVARARIISDGDDDKNRLIHVDLDVKFALDLFAKATARLGREPTDQLLLLVRTSLRGS